MGVKNRSIRAIPLSEFRRGAARGYAAALNLLFPPRCLACGADFDDEPPVAHVCGDCVKAFTTPARACCERCGTWRASTGGDSKCVACEERKFRFDELAALGDYRGELRSAILRAKRPAGEPLAGALGKLLALEARQRLEGWRPDVVVPLPMHWTRRWLRGTNSPERIAAEISRAFGKPVSKLLKRTRRTQPQGTLSPSRRRINVRGAFRLEHADDFRGARVLLVDDVVTSGATCGEAARVLKRAGAEFVGVATVARTQAPA